MLTLMVLVLALMIATSALMLGAMGVFAAMRSAQMSRKLEMPAPPGAKPTNFADR